MPTIKVNADKITAFLHIPVYVPTVQAPNPNKKDEIDEDNIFLPEAIYKEYRKFIINESPDMYKILEKGIDDEHKEKGIVYHFIIKKENYEKFIKMIMGFDEKYKVLVEFGEKLYSDEEMVKLAKKF